MEKLIIIRTLKELQELKEYLADKDFISFDVETTGVDRESEIIGFSVCADIEVGYYVILSYWDTAQQKLVYLETKEGAKAFLQSLVGKSLVMHNGPFDSAMVENNFQVRLIESLHTDTMILAHLLDENRSCGLKELGVALYGQDANKEQKEMKESVHKNGGMLTRDKYELYKADADLLAKYGAKDAILTLKLFYTLVPELFDQGLDKFFYEEESMPLLRGPTYELNTVGLRVDAERLQKLKQELEAECLEAQAFIHKEIAAHVQSKYPGTSKAKTFNINAGKQLAWLLFFKLENEFNTLTKEGRALCKALEIKMPYSPGAKREFIRIVEDNKGRVWQEATFNPKTKKISRPKKVGEPWNYISCGKETLAKLSARYKWADKLLEYKKAEKLLSTYVLGIQSRMKYNIIRPQFLQHGTTSGRYSSKSPNFQNLPRDDKRVKACIVARPGKVLVGADHSQLEPRVFTSVSQDEALLRCFKNGEDFYSVVGIPIFDKIECSAFKKAPNSFAEKHPDLRNISKAFALATPYGTSAFQQHMKLGKSTDECQEIIDRYFAAYPSVEAMMLDSHEQAKANGVVYNLYGRPRRIPVAKTINKIYGNTPHHELPYHIRTLLNLAMNHRVQSTAASIMNRNAIACYRRCRELEAEDAAWKDVKIVLQVHDELILEGPEHLGDKMCKALKDAMENAVQLPGVALIAEPKIGNNLAELK